jgi:glycine betaine transporter
MKIKLNTYRAGVPRASNRSAGCKEAVALPRVNAPADPLSQLKRILVPIDFSTQSLNALRYAVPLADKLGAVICLISVVERGSLLKDLKNMPMGFSRGILVEDAKARLVIMAQKEIGKLIPVIPQVRVGRPFEEIVRAAQRLQADLIVISTHGYTGLKHALLGSTAERVVQHAPCPVLVVCERARDGV